MNWLKTSCSVLLLGSILVLLSSSVAGLWMAGSFNPAKTAPLSDVIVHGTVIEVTPVGDPTIKVIEVLKGEPETEHIKVYTRKRGMVQSEYGTFSEEEEVIIMLEEHNGTYPYEMTHSRASKYGITNGTIQLKEPERKNITVAQMKEIIENPETVDISELSVPDSAEDDTTGDESNEPVETRGGFLTQLWASITAFF